MMNRSTLALCLTAFVATSVLAHNQVEDNGKAGNLDSVNGGITVGNNAEAGNIDTVNGGIRVGKGSKVGKIDAVNGGISLDDGATAVSVDTVNGGFKGGTEVKILQSLESVNGGISLKAGSSIGRDIENVNGKIHLDGVSVAGNIDTVNGPIELKGATKVSGKLIVRKTQSNWCFWDCDSHKPIITIGPDVEVQGGLLLEREVELHIDPNAKIGPIEHAYKK